MEVAETGGTLQAPPRADAKQNVRRSHASAVSTRRVVYTGTAFYALVMIASAIISYRAYDMARLDLGNMVQAVWSTAHGHVLQVTGATGRETIRLAGHVEPFLLLLVPLWWAWPSPLMLLVVQALAVSAGALPVYWLARKHLQSNRAAAHFAFAYLIYPATQFNAFTKAAGFHSASIAVPLILFAIWFLDEERLLPFAVFAVLAASTKEDIPAAVGCLGLWYAVRKGRRWTGVSIFALGLSATLVNFLVIIPHFSPSGINPFAGRYAAVGGTPAGMLHKLVSDPAAFVHTVATTHKLLYLVLLFGPFLGLWLLEPLLFLGALPPLVINLLSAKPEQTTVWYQYTAGIVPFLLAASIVGASRLKRDPNGVSLAVLVSAGSLALLSPVLPAAGDIGAARGSNAVHQAKSYALSLIPAGVPVSASNQLAGYLSARHLLYNFPLQRKAQWAIVDVNDPTSIPSTFYRNALTKLRSSQQWKVAYSSHGVVVLRRVPAR